MSINSYFIFYNSKDLIISTVYMHPNAKSISKTILRINEYWVESFREIKEIIKKIETPYRIESYIDNRFNSEKIFSDLFPTYQWTKVSYKDQELSITTMNKYILTESNMNKILGKLK